MRASEVFPVPRGPANRYAWRTFPAETAFRSVRTTGSWPTTSSNPCGRYLRYSAVKKPAPILCVGPAPSEVGRHHPPLCATCARSSPLGSTRETVGSHHGREAAGLPTGSGRAWDRTRDLPRVKRVRRFGHFWGRVAETV